MAWSRWIRFVGVVGVIAGCNSGSGSGASDSAGGSGSTSTTGGSGASSAGSGTGSAGGTGSTTASPGTSAGGSGSGGTSGSTGGTPDGCMVNAFDPGDHVGEKLHFGGVTRSYDVHVPPGYDGSKPVPLLFNLHGYQSNAAQQAFFSDMNPHADKRGIVVVYPQGTNDSWNAGACCGTAAQTGVDDVGFLRALVEHIEGKLCIDATRVYVTGMSNGGFMSHRLACEAADVFAAAAPVAGVLGIPPADCNPSRPIPVLHVHGNMDPLVPYDGDPALGFASVPDTFAGWSMRDTCTDQPMVTFMQDDVTCQSHAACDASVQVTLCTVDGGGHCWPGQSVCPFGNSTTAYDDEDILDFLMGYTLP